MARNSRSPLSKLSPHGFYALAIILFSQVATGVSLIPIRSLYDRVRGQTAPALVVESAAIDQNTDKGSMVDPPTDRPQLQMITSVANRVAAP